MRLLVVLNEKPAGSHDDVHRAFETLRRESAVRDYFIYPFLDRLASGMTSESVSSEILSLARDLQAEAVLWSHTGRLQVSGDSVQRLRQLPSHPVMGYWDTDMYHWFYKPFPRQALAIASACDVVFPPGYCRFVESLSRKGCNDIRYVPLTTDEERFGRSLQKRCRPDFDVVMVGNRVWSRMPLRTMPGARSRDRLVELLARRFGSRFAVFGQGWTGASAQGPIPFTDQWIAYNSGHVALGVNNLHARYYFSNRLPIALSCGSLLVHNFEAGIDTVLGSESPVRFFTSLDGALAAITDLLELDDLEDAALRRHARSLALTRLTMTDAQRYMVAVLGSIRTRRDRLEHNERVINPWLGREYLRPEASTPEA